MLSRNKTNFLISLQKKKVRDEEKLFVIEGDKLVKEFLFSEIPLMILIARPEFISSIPENVLNNAREIVTAGYDELKKISTLKTPHNAMAVVPMPHFNFDPDIILKGLCAALDFIQDPGNLGTIIRAAAWFGIKNIVCSGNCVDIYNPKAVQASMGAIMHVNVFYSNLHEFLKTAGKKRVPIYGTMLEGVSIYKHNLSDMGVIILGNESKGISDNLVPFISDKLMIPKFTAADKGIDSLNVGMAASVVFSEFARNREKG